MGWECFDLPPIPFRVFRIGGTIDKDPFVAGDHCIGAIEVVTDNFITVGAA